MGRDDWDEQRSSYNRVLQSLEAVIRRHPAGSAQREADANEPSPQLPDNVVDLRVRLAAVRSGSLPDDAA